MDSKIEFERNLHALMLIAKKDVKRPKFGVDELVDEVLDLSITANEDEEKLTAAGLSRFYIRELASRAVTFRYADAVWKASKGASTEFTENWDAEKEEYREFASETIHSFDFAFRKHPVLSKRLKEIREGSSYANMVHDLMTLYVIGTENPEPLQAINYDFSNLERCKEIADDAGIQFALSNDDREERSEQLDVRNRAHAFMMEAANEVREYGKFVFWKDPERYKKYTSGLLRKRNRNKTKKEDNNSDENELDENNPNENSPNQNTSNKNKSED